MKNFKLFISAILFLVSINTQALETRISHEAYKSDKATSVAFLHTESHLKSKQVFKYGISINHISSNQVLANNNRTYISPVYLFANFSINYPLSPFIELGIDLGDKLINDIFDGNNRDIDFYYSFGLSLNIDKRLSVAAYYKYYDIYFNTAVGYPYIIEEVNLSLAGVSLSYSF